MRGSRVHKKIRARVLAAREELAGLTRAERETAAQLEALVDEKADLFMELAKHYLPELGASAIDEIAEEVPAIRKRLGAILEEKRDQRQRLERLVEQNRVARDKVEKDLDEVTEKLESKVEERNSLAALVEGELQENEGYRRLFEETEIASDRLSQQRRRLEAARGELAEKAPAYAKNILFAYLLERGYATPGYKGGSFTRSLDAWVAGLVDFERQKKSYAHLHDVHQVMEKEVDRCQARFDEKNVPLDTMEQKVSDRHGLTRVIEEGRVLYEERSAIVNRLEDMDSKHGSYLERLEELEGSQGEYYDKAVFEFAAFLERQEVKRLWEIARSTETRSDDGMVHRIQELDADWRWKRDRSREARNARAKAKKRLDGLKKIETKFLKNNYDASNSRFGWLFDIEDLLDGYLAGRYTAGHVSGTIRKQQSFSYRRSRSSSSGWSSGSSFSSGSSGFSSGGGFSSGSGFSTGGGF